MLRRARSLWSLLTLAGIAFSSAAAVAQAPATPEVVAPGVPSPGSVVDAMMRLADVGPDDYVVDLGSGDGRIVIAAVGRYRARGGFGVDINPVAIAQANENAVKAGVADRVQFHERDMFATDVRDATVVTIYLMPSIMGKVERKLRAELKPGARIVVHDFPFPDWRPEKTILVESLDKLGVTGFALSQLYLYRVPPRP
ncbi:MAG TPA: methyltransferase domain-containing protein [Casimicrobiaceae bacterium]|nr:methyltransferase domain-containing protein [Casimicrobiaceae bacterium]